MTKEEYLDHCQRYFVQEVKKYLEIFENSAKSPNFIQSDVQSFVNAVCDLKGDMEAILKPFKINGFLKEKPTPVEFEVGDEVHLEIDMKNMTCTFSSEAGGQTFAMRDVSFQKDPFVTIEGEDREYKLQTIDLNKSIYRIM